MTALLEVAVVFAVIFAIADLRDESICSFCYLTAVES
ncbi:hypothetical protein N836_03305 [Leptolyngbya sp. Heron Island J]|nr:hypothetical protein N836_03305 [Leptolyngbya sp. Heron Island J]